MDINEQIEKQIEEEKKSVDYDTREFTIEIVVDSTCVLFGMLVEEGSHRMRHVYLVWEYDKAVHRAIPMYLTTVAKGIPWKYTVGVGK